MFLRGTCVLWCSLSSSECLVLLILRKALGTLLYGRRTRTRLCHEHIVHTALSKPRTSAPAAAVCIDCIITGTWYVITYQVRGITSYTWYVYIRKCSVHYFIQAGTSTTTVYPRCKMAPGIGTASKVYPVSVNFPELRYRYTRRTTQKEVSDESSRRILHAREARKVFLALFVSGACCDVKRCNLLYLLYVHTRYGCCFKLFSELPPRRPKHDLWPPPPPRLEEKR